jgi:hypothetical protein
MFLVREITMAWPPDLSACIGKIDAITVYVNPSIYVPRVDVRIRVINALWFNSWP